MQVNQRQFEDRLKSLENKHRAMSRGYVTQMQSDGLIVARPKRKLMRLSGKTLIIFVLGFFLFKGFLLANLGAPTYGERLGYLQNGTAVERAGAVVMQADPVTRFVADKMQPHLPRTTL